MNKKEFGKLIGPCGPMLHESGEVIGKKSEK